MRLKLLVQCFETGESSLVNFENANSVCTLGRSDAADIQILDQLCSRRHAILKVLENRLQIEDMGSRNGIKVAGTKVLVSSLQAGDTFEVGSTHITVLNFSPLAPGPDEEITVPDDIIISWPEAFHCIPKPKQKDFDEYQR